MNEFLLAVAEKLHITIEVNPSKLSSLRPGAFALAMGEENVILLSEPDDYVLAHELLHFVQYDHELAVFATVESLRSYCLKHNIPFDEGFAEFFLPVWEELVDIGRYSREDWAYEWPAYYVTHATTGMMLFDSIIEQVGII